jgi:hypothetical protein
MPLRPVLTKFATPPVRTETHPVSPDQVAARDAELAELARRLASPRINGSVSTVERTKFRVILDWVAKATFEDTAVEFFRQLPNTASLGEDVIAPFVIRELDAADAAGHIWTPLLDAMAAAYAWTPKLVQNPEVRLTRLHHWLAKQRTEEVMAPLRAFHYRQFCQALLTRFPAALLTPTWMEWALARSGGGAALASNPGLTVTQRLALVETAVSMLVARVDAPPGTRAHHNIYVLEGFFLHWLPTHGPNGLTPDQVARIAAANDALGIPAPNSQGELDRHRLNLVLVRNRTTPTDVLDGVVARAPYLATDWTLAHHPNTSIKILRKMVVNGPAANWGYIIRNPAAMQDPAIIKRFQASTAAAVMRALCEAAAPQDFDRLFQKLIAKHPLEAVNLIVEKTMPAGVRVRREQILPLFSSPSQAVRTKAVMGVHALETEGLLDDSPAPEAARLRLQPADPVAHVAPVASAYPAVSAAAAAAAAGSQSSHGAPRIGSDTGSASDLPASDASVSADSVSVGSASAGSASDDSSREARSKSGHATNGGAQRGGTQKGSTESRGAPTRSSISAPSRS